MGRLLAGGLAIAGVAGGAVAIWLVGVDAEELRKFEAFLESQA